MSEQDRADVASRPTPELIRPVVEAALRWLYETEQPERAILQHLGVMLPGPARSGRKFFAVPRGANGRPVLVTEVASPRHDGRTGDLLTPLHPDELRDLAGLVVGLGYDVAETWNGHPAETGSVGLTRTAHPTLLAAVDRYRSGCPEHEHSVFCRCGWFRDGRAHVVNPTVDPAPTPGLEAQ